MMALDKRGSSADSLNQHAPSGVDPRRSTGRNVPPPDFTSGGEGGDPDPFNEACSLVWVNLAAYKDEELDQDTYEAVDNHMAHCSRCSAMLKAMQETDILIEREWRDHPPLPSPSEVKQSIDNIMAALPPAADELQEFAAKRIHAKVRWMRFSTGFTGVIALFSLLWTSYRVGYTQGSKSSDYRTKSSGSPTTLSPTVSAGDLSSAIGPPSSIARTSSYTSSAVISRMHL